MAKRTTFTVQIEGLDRVLAELARRQRNVGAELENALVAGGEVIADAARGNARSTAQSVARGVRVVKRPQSRGKALVVVGSTSPLAHLFEWGAAPHEITPENRRALRLADGWFARRVQHPGMAAHPWLRPAFDSQQRNAQARIRQKLQTALEK